MLTDAAMAQASHLSPVDLCSLLVRDVKHSVLGRREMGIRFGTTSHGFTRIQPSTKYHCLHWSCPDIMQPPAMCFPVVGDHLSMEMIGDLLRLVNKSGSVSFFLPKKGNHRFLGLLRLIRGSDGVFTINTTKAQESWSFQTQFITEEEKCCDTSANAIELFTRKLVMWIFRYYSLQNDKQLTLPQLELAFPLLTAMDMQERRRFLSGALTRFAGGLLSFYDDRVISLRNIPISACGLLSMEEVHVVTSVEQASVAFIFKCQMRHDEVLNGLQTILDCWGKRGYAFPSSLIRQAIAVLLSHVIGTCALLQSALKGWVRPFVLHHLQTFMRTCHGPIATKLSTLLKSIKTQKTSKGISFKILVDDIVNQELFTAGSPALCDLQKHKHLEKEVDNMKEGFEVTPDGGYIFDSVLPVTHSVSGLAWKITRDSCRYTTISLPDAPPTSNDELIGTPADLIFSTALFSGGRLHLSQPLFKYAVEAELCLSLNFGKVTQYAAEEEDDVWQSTRKRRRERRLL
ncbi:uncharacterized protein TM35_000017290 [Trypanosoma theileri]|uniref:Uncharacterized protein n=1 Tax=Trypanosoma theileri TaxID=67003 RepID=A0A1X0PA95_9TRYP|nr:uncharacterized protein TM35_000017290 [Trypanosoma theileri]ORC93852.1 hypothetical protein TM35_000017290 [Trypanosoma theileri]